MTRAELAALRSDYRLYVRAHPRGTAGFETWEQYKRRRAAYTGSIWGDSDMNDNGGYSGGWGGTSGSGPAFPALPPVDTPTDWSWVTPVSGGIGTLLKSLGFGEDPAPQAPPQVIVQPSAIPTWLPWVIGGGIGLYLLTDGGRRRR